MDLSNLVSQLVLVGCLGSTVAGLALVRKAANRRIRLLSLSVVLLTFCEVSSTATKFMDLNSENLARSIQILQLTASALTLSFVHLLNRENRARVNADIRLRVLESHGPSPDKIDQRLAPRFKLEEPATLEVLSLYPGIELAVRAANISRGGIQVICEEDVPCKEQVSVVLCGVRLSGKVVACQPATAGFRVGISLDTRLDDDVLDEIVLAHHRCREEPLAVEAMTQSAAANNSGLDCEYLIRGGLVGSTEGLKG